MTDRVNLVKLKALLLAARALAAPYGRKSEVGLILDDALAMIGDISAVVWTVRKAVSDKANGRVSDKQIALSDTSESRLSDKPEAVSDNLSSESDATHLPDQKDGKEGQKREQGSSSEAPHANGKSHSGSERAATVGQASGFVGHEDDATVGHDIAVVGQYEPVAVGQQRVLRDAMAAAWDGYGGLRVNGANRRKCLETLPALLSIATEQDRDPIDVFRAGAARFKADAGVKRRRLGLVVFLSQLEQWCATGDPSSGDGAGEVSADFDETQNPPWANQ
jgi:hypothetical protein